MMSNHNVIIDAQEDIYPIELGGDFYPSLIDVDESGDAEIVIVDNLDFHEDHIDREIVLDDLAQLRLKIISHLPKFMDAQHNLTVDFESDDAFTVRLFIGNTAGKSVDEIVETYWDMFAIVSNILDPGSFGWEYAF